MYEDFFAERLSALRQQKNVSAREMSLALGQNGSYINRIENKHAFPSMQTFFYICEYLEITPQDFFNTELENPGLVKEWMHILKDLDNSQIENLTAIAKGLQKNKG